jgi:hypothetical protein
MKVIPDVYHCTWLVRHWGGKVAVGEWCFRQNQYDNAIEARDNTCQFLNIAVKSAVQPLNA